MPNENLKLMDEFHKTVFEALFISYSEYLLDMIEARRNNGLGLSDVSILISKLGIHSLKHHVKDSYHRLATKYVMGCFTTVETLEDLDTALNSLKQLTEHIKENSDRQLQELIKRLKESSNIHCSSVAENFELSDKYLGIIAEKKALMAMLEEIAPGTSGRTGRGHV